MKTVGPKAHLTFMQFQAWSSCFHKKKKARRRVRRCRFPQSIRSPFHCRRRQPPTPPLADACGEDRTSCLPDELLHGILLYPRRPACSTAAGAASGPTCPSSCYPATMGCRRRPRSGLRRRRPDPREPHHNCARRGRGIPAHRVAAAWLLRF